ncbi:MAG: hypothetical protein HY814_11565 [Candidatus Riflebacteria bacterium]|nr:hypothetical protein [Candidatus Riflebacteria bacterium]
MTPSRNPHAIFPRALFVGSLLALSTLTAGCEWPAGQQAASNLSRILGGLSPQQRQALPNGGNTPPATAAPSAPPADQSPSIAERVERFRRDNTVFGLPTIVDGTLPGKDSSK